jgi:hypothetical protein
MALPAVGYGYQIGDGNVKEPQLFNLGNVQTASSTATLTVTQLLNGLLVADPSTSAAAYTYPTAAAIDTALNTPKVGTAFELTIVNKGTSSGAITLTTNTGITIVGLVTIPITTTQGSSAKVTFVKTADGAYTAYRTA